MSITADSSQSRSDLSEGLPEGIAALPVDQRNGLPVPWSTPSLANGRPDFSRNDGGKVWQAALGRLCGTCGQRIDVHVAFLGTEATVAAGFFFDPPMHPDCARAALRLCPHIVRQAPVSVQGTAVRHDVEGWTLWITRDYQWGKVQQMIAFVPGPAHRLERYVYDQDGQLVPATAVS